VNRDQEKNASPGSVRKKLLVPSMMGSVLFHPSTCSVFLLSSASFYGVNVNSPVSHASADLNLLLFFFLLPPCQAVFKKKNSNYSLKFKLASP
jgi:hypothetical protein